MLTPGVAAPSTLSASAVTSGPMPSPPTTASLMVRELMPEPYWRGGDGGRRVRGGRVAAVVPAVQGRLDGLGRGRLTGGLTGVRVPPGPEGLGRVVPLAVRVPGIHVVHGSAPDRDPGSDLRPAANPRSGLPACLRSGSAAAGDEYEMPDSACYV